MQFYIQSVTIFSLIAAATAVPGPSPETVRLDNGEETVNALTSGPSQRSINGRGNLSCKGSAFCERLGGSCDDAYRQIEPGKYVSISLFASNIRATKLLTTVNYSTYLTGGNKGSSEVCSGTCGVFVDGDHCQVLGSQMQASYKAIRNYGCSHCGWEELDNGCKVKIDRVTGC